MQHRLILFTGSSPGAGKSTLSGLLFKQFKAMSLPVRWLHEEDIVKAFERFIPGMAIEKLTPDLLLQASERLVEECLAENATWIVDSHLPGFYYLYGRYPDTALEAFSTKLQSTLSPLQPLIIYLRSDVETALMRGAAQRGMQWLENLTRYLKGWQLPVYGGGILKPLRTIPDVIDFFTRVDGLTVTLLEQWPYALILEASQMSVGPLLTTILSHLKLTEHDTGYYVLSEELGRYTGLYIPVEGEQETKPLVVSLVDNALFVNTYWPAGARLLPEGKAKFRLEGTNRHIAFELKEDGQSYSLIYSSSESAHTYKQQR
jgi:hypothetical protein